MKMWLIEIIHNLDLMCNVICLGIGLMVLIAMTRSRSFNITMSRKLSRIWWVSFLGVLFIPTKETLIALIL